MKENIKCPRCHAQGKVYLSEGRYFFYCVTCGLQTLLKLLNSSI